MFLNKFQVFLFIRQSFDSSISIIFMNYIVIYFRFCIILEHRNFDKRLQTLFCFNFQEQQKDDFINQLTASIQPISRIQLKVLGHSGVGKTSLLDSLKCGYFSSWFRRSKSNSTSSVGSGYVKTRNGKYIFPLNYFSS